MTHDLMASAVRALGARLDRVIISDLRDNTFFATLRLVRADGATADVDSRPSDAVAMAVHLGAPIFVEDRVLETVLAGPSED
jgi:bifunctional DNase/RNase